CPGCWNMDTWAFENRDLRTVDDLAENILATDGIEGVTFTGGEPFAQACALALLAERVRAAGLSVFIFTGYDLEELVLPDHRTLLALSDVVVAGRYIETQHENGLAWRGSTNQQVHYLTDQYGPINTEQVAEVEFHLGENGTLAVTGFPPPDLLTVFTHAH
ncbi:radical SAM protein, partial [Myxococcota bacterium]|nr:radical SAM protein [Myxococcota bacterium]